MKDTPPAERLFSAPGFAFLLAAAIFTCFPEVLLGSHSFYFRDYGLIGFPNIHFLQQSARAGELPLWNPYSNCGVPFFAQWGAMCAYPLSAIPAFLPLPWSLGFFCFLHWWLGGMGMYLLARRWTANSFAGAVAGAGYSFSGVMFASFVWPNYFVALGWMPFVVLLAERAWREGGRWIALAALVAALQIGSGVPEIIVLTWLIVGALWLCDFAEEAGNAARIASRLFSVVLLAAGLMAVQLLPFFDFLAHSQRLAGALGSKWALPAWGSANLIVPLLNCYVTPQGQYFQYGQEFLSSVYLGAPVVVLALAGVIKYSAARAWALVLLSITCVLLALGDNTPLFSMVQKAIPIASLARYPVKFLFGPAFVLPLLASLAVRAAHVEPRVSVRAISYGALLVVAAGAALVWMSNNGMLADSSAWPSQFRANVAQHSNEAVWNAALRGLLLVGVVVAVIYSGRRSAAGAVAALAAFALIVVDGRTHAPNQNPTLPAAELVGIAWNTNAGPYPKLGQERVFIPAPAEKALLLLTDTNRAQVWRAKRQSEWSNLNLLDSVPKVNGSATLRLKHEAQFESALYALTNVPPGVLDFLGVTRETGNQAGSWNSRASALPLVTAGQGIFFADDDGARRLMLSPQFNPRSTLILPMEQQRSITATSAVSIVVTNIQMTARRVVADIDASAQGPVVIAQSYSSSWRGMIDREIVPVFRANSAFQAVIVPAGKHRVALEYYEPMLRVGGGVSAVAGIVCLVVLLTPARRP